MSDTSDGFIGAYIVFDRTMTSPLPRPQSAPASTTTLRSSLTRWIPSRCHICNAWPASPICNICATRFGRPESRCERCALPLTGGAKICGACLRHSPPIDACFSAVTYQWPWTECLARFKFRQDTGLAGALAELLLGAPGVPSALAKADLILPLPLAPQRLAERGYN